MFCFHSCQYQTTSLSCSPAALTWFISDKGTQSHFCRISQNTMQTASQILLGPWFYTCVTPFVLVIKCLIQHKVRIVWRDNYWPKEEKKKKDKKDKKDQVSLPTFFEQKWKRNSSLYYSAAALLYSISDLTLRCILIFTIYYITEPWSEKTHKHRGIYIIVFF